MRPPGLPKPPKPPGPPKPPPHGPWAAKRAQPKVLLMAEEREYGVAANFDFPLVVFGSTDADFSTGVSFAAGDIRLSKDGSTWVNINSTGSAQIGINSGVYTLTLDSTEMQMARGMVIIQDQSSTKIWEDQAILITTYGSTAALHAFNRNSTSPNVNTAAMGIGVIGSTQIGTDAITAAKIAANAIGASELAANAIGSTQIASSAITADKIATDAITSAKIASGALTTDEIADGVFTQFWAESTRSLTTLGFQLAAADFAANAISSGVISSGMVAMIVDDVWDEVLTGATHNVAASAGRRLRLLTGVVSIDGAVNSTAATPTSIPTNTTQGVDHWNDALMVFLSGALIGQARAVQDYSTAGVVTIDAVDAFTLAPANGDEFVFVSDHIHPISQIADGVWDELIAGHTTAGTFGAGVRLASGVIGSTQFIAGAINSTAIATGAFTASKFAADALTTTIIAQGVFDKQSDGVWDEAKAGHVAAGSFGEEVQSHALSAEISALNDLSAAEVNAEILDVLTVDTFGEPVTTTSAPIVSETLARKLGTVYAGFINRLDVSTSSKTFYTSTGGIAFSKVLTDDGTYSEAFVST